jgi:hypothetical protein
VTSTNAQQKVWRKCGLDITQHQLLFCYCATVVGRDGTLLNKKFYLELLNKKSTIVPGCRMLLPALRQARNVACNFQKTFLCSRTKRKSLSQIFKAFISTKILITFFFQAGLLRRFTLQILSSLKFLLCGKLLLYFIIFGSDNSGF